MQFKGIMKGNKKLSPRLEEFLTNKKEHISRLMNESELKMNEISEYPDRKEARLKERSFENIKPSQSLKVFTINQSQGSLNRINYNEELPKKDLETYHFKIDLKNENVMFKRELQSMEEEKSMEEIKTMRASGSQKFLSRVREENQKNLNTNKKHNFPAIRMASSLNNSILGKANEFELEDSKLFWKNRPKNKKGCIIKPGHCNSSVISPEAFVHKFMNYLRIDFPKGYWDDRTTLRKYHEIIDAAINPLEEVLDKRQLLFDCKRLLKTVTSPVFTGDCTRELNLIDFTLVNDLLEQQKTKGIDYTKKF